MANVGKTDFTVVEPTIQQLISSVVLDNFTEFGKILPLVNDISAQLGKGQNAISFPCVSDFDTQKQTFPLTVPGATTDGTVDPDGNAIVCQTLEVVTDTLKVDCKAVTGFKYDPCDLYQSVLNVESELLSKASNALIRQVESTLLTRFDEVSADNELTAITPGEVSEGDLICLHAALNKKNIPESDRCYLVNPEQMKALYALKCIKEVASTGDATSPFRNGVLGTIMGSPVIWDNRVPEDCIYYFHKDAVRYAQQNSVSVLETDVPKMGCKEMSFTLKYGCKTLKDGCRIAKLTV